MEVVMKVLSVGKYRVKLKEFKCDGTKYGGGKKFRGRGCGAILQVSVDDIRVKEAICCNSGVDDGFRSQLFFFRCPNCGTKTAVGYIYEPNYAPKMVFGWRPSKAKAVT